MTFLRGQSSSEFMVLFAVSLTVLLVALSLSVVWTSYVHSAEKQRSEKYWAGAKPISIRDYALYQSQLLLEIENTEPIALTVKKLYVGGRNLSFYNHSIPFTWAQNARCSGGVCTLYLLPGETQIVTTANFTDELGNPCVSSSSPLEGAWYEIELVFTYHASDPSVLENQTGSVKLSGYCQRR